MSPVPESQMGGGDAVALAKFINELFGIIGYLPAPKRSCTGSSLLFVKLRNKTIFLAPLKTTGSGASRISPTGTSARNIVTNMGKIRRGCRFEQGPFDILAEAL
jgi:hypothetical protein